jgi:hypothetical protein
MRSNLNHARLLVPFLKAIEVLTLRVLSSYQKMKKHWAKVPELIKI